MKFKLKINQNTTNSELIILGAFFKSLAVARKGNGNHVDADAHVGTYGNVEPNDDPTPADTTVVAEAEAPKRRRRTKAEVEATAIAEAEAAAQVSNEAGLAAIIAEQEATTPLVDTPAPTPDAPVTDTKEKAAAPAAATESPSNTGKTYTAAEVQQQATVVARTHGADTVMAKIKELGGTRVADLTPEKLNELGDYLSSVK